MTEIIQIDADDDHDGSIAVHVRPRWVERVMQDAETLAAIEEAKISVGKRRHHEPNILRHG